MKYIKIILLFLILNISLYGTDLNIDILSKEAKKYNKQLLLFFHMTYCPYCEKMLEENFKDKKFLKEFNKNFILVDINVNDSGNIIYKEFNGDRSDFAYEYDVRFYPTTKFINDDKITYSVKGYRNKEKFDLILKYVKTKSYGKMTLEEFIDEVEMADD